MSFQYICGCCRMLRIYALTNEVSPLWFPVVQLGTTDSLKLGMLMEHERWAGSSDHLFVCITFSSKGTNKGPCDFMLSSYSLVKTALFPLPNISFVTPKHWPVWTILFIPPLPVLWPQVLCTWPLDHLFPLLHAGRSCKSAWGDTTPSPDRLQGVCFPFDGSPGIHFTHNALKCCDHLETREIP